MSRPSNRYTLARLPGVRVWSRTRGERRHQMRVSCPMLRADGELVCKVSISDHMTITLGEHEVPKVREALEAWERIAEEEYEDAED